MEFTNARATYEQEGWTVVKALKTGRAEKVEDEPGWAIQGGTGRSQTALFYPAGPVEFPAGARLRVTLECQNERWVSHVLGAFRLAIASGENLAKFDALPKALRSFLERDPETLTRISQYELAFRMQMSVPDATDISSEPKNVHERYGTEAGKNSFANNCLLARRLCERGVRFIQLYDWGWDAHGTDEGTALKGGHQRKLHTMDKAVSALLADLKQRGMLEDTLLICGAEFGRTPMKENRSGKDNPFNGRDHSPGGFTVWLAGGGVKRGLSYGATDAFGYEAVQDKVHVHDLNATLLHLLGFDHTKLIYTFEGRHYRLTDVHGEVVAALLA